MKNIVIKSALALLLIIEFYPIESNSQTVNEGIICYIYDSNKEQINGNSENFLSGSMEYQETGESKSDNSKTENAYPGLYDENVRSDEQSEDAIFYIVNYGNAESLMHGKLNSPTDFDSFTQFIGSVIIKH